VNFYEVAGVEEYSLPLMMISLYVFTKYYFSQKEPPFYELVMLGSCFAAAVFIRINMFSLWLGFCLAVAASSIVARRWALLVKYILCFIAGIALVFIPVFLYLTRNNAAGDYINQNLLSGSSRAFAGFGVEGFIKSSLMIMYKNFCFVPLLAGFVWIVKKQKNINVFYSVGFLLAYLLTVFFHGVMRTNYDHYNMTLTPFLVPAFTFGVKICFACFSGIKHKKTLVPLFLLLVFARETAEWVYDVYTIARQKDKTRNEFAAAGEQIDRNTEAGDTIISLGLSCPIYLFTQRDPASRYIYQISGAAHDPNMQSTFLADIQRNKPRIVAVRKDENGRYDYLPGWYEPVYTMLADHYRLLSAEGPYCLFIRGDA
jgi:hypothetical protein